MSTQRSKIRGLRKTNKLLAKNKSGRGQVRRQRDAVVYKESLDSELLYQYVFDNVNDAIFIHDLSGHFLQVNKIACQRLGYSRAEFLKMGVKQLDVPEVAAHYDESMQVFMEKKSLVADTRHVRKDGTSIPVEVSARLIEYKGQAAVLTVARDLSDRERLEAEIQERNRELAIREERDRLGRELHDGLGQVLGFIGVKTSGINELLRQSKTEEAQQGLAELTQVAQAAYADVREAILGLRATVTAGLGLEPILREYLHRYQREWSIATELNILNDASTHFPPQVEIQLLRIIQEALTNVRKHAQAIQVWIQFDQTDRQVIITVKDDGIGFDPQQLQGEHFGLQTMHERVDSVGGQLRVTSAPRAGTRVDVILPRP